MTINGKEEDERYRGEDLGTEERDREVRGWQFSGLLGRLLCILSMNSVYNFAAGVLGCLDSVFRTNDVFDFTTGL
jgi:hypothetical protein